MALTHMVAVEYAESCLFVLYAENDGDAHKFCSDAIFREMPTLC